MVTKKQKLVLDFIESYVQKFSYYPSYDEIACGLGLKSLATVHKHIHNLVAKGLLHNTAGSKRSICLPERCPTCGSPRAIGLP